MLNTAPSVPISSLNDLLVLDDKVCKPSTSSYHIDLSIS